MNFTVVGERDERYFAAGYIYKYLFAVKRGEIAGHVEELRQSGDLTGDAEHRLAVPVVKPRRVRDKDNAGGDAVRCCEFGHIADRPGLIFGVAVIDKVRLFGIYSFVSVSVTHVVLIAERCTKRLVGDGHALHELSIGQPAACGLGHEVGIKAQPVLPIRAEARKLDTGGEDCLAETSLIVQVVKYHAALGAAAV